MAALVPIAPHNDRNAAGGWAALPVLAIVQTKRVSADVLA